MWLQELSARVSAKNARWRKVPAFSWRAVDNCLSYLFDVGNASVLFVAPFFMGGRHPLGCLVYVALICLTASVWLARQLIRPLALETPPS